MAKRVLTSSNVGNHIMGFYGLGARAMIAFILPSIKTCFDTYHGETMSSSYLVIVFYFIIYKSYI